MLGRSSRLLLRVRLGLVSAKRCCYSTDALKSSTTGKKRTSLLLLKLARNLLIASSRDAKFVVPIFHL
jgi:hypothetical protein